MAGKYFIISLLVLTSIILGSVLKAKSQNNLSSEEYLKKHVYILASDSLEGRATGTRGQKKAAEYIASKYKEYGLHTLPNNTYFHNYQLKRQHKNYVKVKSNADPMFAPWHFHFVSGYNHSDTLNTKVVFTGYGSQAEIESVSVDDKAVAFIADSPQKAYENIRRINKTKGTSTFFVLFPRKNKDLERVWETDYITSEYVLPKMFKQNYDFRITEEWAEPTDSVNVFYCFSNVMRNIFQLTDFQLEDITNRNVTPNNALLANVLQPNIECFINYNDSIQEIDVENVGGIVYGKDTEETIVVSAHYDHLGIDMGEVYYGADDNASGTSVLLELARQFGQIETENKPQRNILFLAFSGEEIGLYGSEAYVDNPVFSLDSTVININMDMVGRWDSRHDENSSFVYLLNGGKGSKRYFKLGKKKLNLPTGFDVSKNPGVYEKLVFKVGSDHYSFHKRNVPISVIFTGLHDDYHTPNDTPEKLNYQNLTNIGNMVYQYIYHIANNPKDYPVRFEK